MTIEQALKELSANVQVAKRTHINSSEAWQLVAWLNNTYPDIFKEFVAVLDVYRKANESDDGSVETVESEG